MGQYLGRAEISPTGHHRQLFCQRHRIDVGVTRSFAHYARGGRYTV